MITYCRMEAKLIHGQTTTILRNRFKCDGIIVVDEQLAGDPRMKTVYAAATPQPIKPYFFGIDKGIEQMRKAETSDRNYFTIFRNALTVSEVLKKGYRFTVPVVCGQQFKRENTTSLMFSVFMTEEEIEALKYIADSGTELVFDPSAKGENVPWSKIKNGLNGNKSKNV